ncbi:GAS2-like protein pickled eggs, partial [Gryllus bimaculatus]
MSPVLDEGALTPVLRDARSVRPFRSSEDYLLAMKEDLAEWLNVLYPELDVSADFFMEHLETGVALCKHANAVLEAAETLRSERADWLESHPNSTQAHLVAAVAAHGPVNYHVQSARPGTFFARDNVSNFITWARRALNLEREIDREIAAEQRGRQGSGSGDDDAADDDDDDELLLPAGPQPQLVTNDLKSLHE